MTKTNVDKSCINIKNHVGASIEPCGTPTVIGKTLDTWLEKPTNCLVSTKRIWEEVVMRSLLSWNSWALFSFVYLLGFLILSPYKLLSHYSSLWGVIWFLWHCVAPSQCHLLDNLMSYPKQKLHIQHEVYIGLCKHGDERMQRHSCSAHLIMPNCFFAFPILFSMCLLYVYTSVFGNNQLILLSTPCSYLLGCHPCIPCIQTALCYAPDNLCR